ncbi:ribosome biogenesis protein YTM1 [Durotheca rogersii]|uniref:ribosome biogenesis protein YTM1 n=1 Tax=Durotheca rogersii TaxID=419775 RepID=UPI002220567C|nr:ribosome biogenesis protein YTM1 [Durotheca rogersii]KAI5865526.1 ribosome biogenesis protein YTM1 [Durotheca rogersii]
MDSSSASRPAAPEPQQIRVNFTTSSPDLQLPEGRTQLLVPADIKRYGLSRVLNSESMLNTPAPIPFDFLVDGSFLRTSLAEYLRASGLSAETAVTLQYVRSLIPPVYEASFEHDDWVSDVDLLSETSRAGLWSTAAGVAAQDRILSASYDGLLRIWNGSGDVLATSPPSALGGHSASPKAAKFLSASQIASAGLDRTVRIWKYAESDDRLSGTLKPALELHGHRAAVEALDVHGPTGRVLSAGSDGTVGLWTTSKTAAPPAPASALPPAPASALPPAPASALPPGAASSSKRRKIAAASAAPQRGPLSLLQPHASAASAVQFDPSDPTVGYSASRDRTLRTIDLTTARVEGTIATSHPLLALCAFRGGGGGGNAGSTLLAAGTAARQVAIADPRVSAAAPVVMTLRGHRNLVSCLAAAPGGAGHALVSGSHDGTCRVWDLRSARSPTAAVSGAEGVTGESAYVVERESQKGAPRRSDVPGRGAKVFGVAWDRRWGIVSAGEDRQVQINRGRDLLPATATEVAGKD